jgi:putative ABC transport system substrate-binding protein
VILGGGHAAAGVHRTVRLGDAEFFATELFRRAGSYVHRILGGAKPGDLPVEQPTKFELLINLKTAKTISLTVPEPFLLRAGDIVE